MNHKEKLLEIYKRSFSLSDLEIFNVDTQQHIKTIGEKINSQKGVFTVLVTLITHKIIDPKQDVRKHQASMSGGFSGRSIDAQYITPTLKEIGLPSMAESGWLTRSLEQPYPYNLDYNGKISDKKVKEAFLEILEYIENNPKSATDILRLLLSEAIHSKNDTIVEIIPLENPEKLTIQNIIEALDTHFKTNYRVAGGSKLPVLAFFALYKCLMEMPRYKDCVLSTIGSHTASDKTSKTAGDIEVFKKEKLFEAVEIKLDKAIDGTMVRIAIEKIRRHNPDRYYILSYINVKKGEEKIIADLVDEIKDKHGCQLIINGLLPTIKYYLRLLSELKPFVAEYSQLIELDTEIKKVHKEKWNELIAQL